MTSIVLICNDNFILVIVCFALKNKFYWFRRHGRISRNINCHWYWKKKSRSLSKADSLSKFIKQALETYGFSSSRLSPVWIFYFILVIHCWRALLLDAVCNLCTFSFLNLNYVKYINSSLFKLFIAIYSVTGQRQEQVITLNICSTNPPNLHHLSIYSPTSKVIVDR